MSKTIITSICWIKKQKVFKVPDEFTKEYQDLEKDNLNKDIDLLLKKENGDITQTLNDLNSVPTFSSEFKGYFVKNNKKKENFDDIIDTTKINNDIDLDKLNNDFDEISLDDEEDLILNPNDNLILCTTAQDDISNLEVYVYDESAQNFYIHHDILLSSYPLCVDWLGLGGDDKTGYSNFGILGTFMPEIEIWNLDSINPLEPELILCSKNDKEGHSDAVLGLNVNPFDKKILVSGSADSKVILWDILNENPIQCYKEHNNKVQTVKFNKCEDNVMLSGSYDHSIKIYDIRSNKSVIKLNVNCDIECIEFNPLNKFKFMVSYENGYIEEYDMNNLTKPVFSFEAHKKAVTGVTYSPQIPDLFVSSSLDTHLKVWDSSTLTESIFSNGKQGFKPTMIADKFLKKTTGELFSCKFADDINYTVAVGGSKGELLLWQLEESKVFCDKYGLKWIDPDLNKNYDKFNNINKKKILSNRIKFSKTVDTLSKKINKSNKKNLSKKTN